MVCAIPLPCTRSNLQAFPLPPYIRTLKETLHLLLSPFKVHQLQFMLATSHGVPARVSVSKPMAVGLNFGSAFQYRIDLVVLSCPLGSSSGPETLIRNLILMLSEADLVKASCRGHLMRGASACRTSKLVRDEDSISQY